jgi:hypothetical protein
MAQTMTRTDMQACIEECTSCHNICAETVAYCLEQGGRHAEPAHIRLLLDCADICRTSADFMLRGSELHGYTCGICAAICELCAQDCERFGDDEMMRRCAEACRSCADSCRQMASIAGQPHAA